MSVGGGKAWVFEQALAEELDDAPDAFPEVCLSDSGLLHVFPELRSFNVAYKTEISKHEKQTLKSGSAVPCAVEAAFRYRSGDKTFFEKSCYSVSRSGSIETGHGA
jgi:hypothetical protein